MAVKSEDQFCSPSSKVLPGRVPSPFCYHPPARDKELRLSSWWAHKIAGDEGKVVTPVGHRRLASTRKVGERNLYADTVRLSIHEPEGTASVKSSLYWSLAFGGKKRSHLGLSSCSHFSKALIRAYVPLQVVLFPVLQNVRSCAQPAKARLAV